LSQLERLIEDAGEELLAAESDAYETARFDDPAERDATVAWLRANPTADGILALLALRREAPGAYASIPPATRARILTAAMRDRAALNDFGYIDEDGGYDREAGRALLELGDAAVAPLAEELDDVNPGQLEGSEEATLTEIYGLRRADFAYRFLARILGDQPEFDPDPAVRDTHIAALRERITAASSDRP
jgi:hypothetical protein